MGNKLKGTMTTSARYIYRGCRSGASVRLRFFLILWLVLVPGYFLSIYGYVPLAKYPCTIGPPPIGIVTLWPGWAYSVQCVDGEEY